jgi:predicted PhzF superfamily epimerase YddE/YHI9
LSQLRLRTVDAFTDKPFTGNPAAVVTLDEAPSNDWMAAACETNLPDTVRERAFSDGIATAGARCCNSSD